MELPLVEAAARLAARGRGGPGAVQAQYDAARDLEEALVRAQPVSTGCLPLLRAAEEYARGRVLEAEGFDRHSPAVASAGTKLETNAADRLSRLPRACSSGERVRAPARRELTEPRSGEAFFGSVRARAPAAATEVEVLVDGRRWAIVRARGPAIRFPLRTAPGRHDVELRFLDGTRLVGSARSDDVWLLPASGRRSRRPGSLDRDLAARLAALANGFPGQSAIWVENLASGTRAGWNTDARFPAASTVKLAVLVAALARFGPRPERSQVAHDLAALTGWSSNLAANRLLRKLGGSEYAGARIAQSTLARLGAMSSTYTGDYRVGTSATRPGEDAPDPPPLVSRRVTTARDLARILYLVHSAGLGAPAALRASGLTEHEARVGLALLLGSRQIGENVGLLRSGPGRSFPVAEKNGWLDDARHTAAILYAPTGPRIAVVLTYRTGIAHEEAVRLGRRVTQLSLAEQ